MSQVVEVPNVGQVEFPDDFSEEQIKQALGRQFGLGPRRNALSETAVGLARGAAQVPIGLLSLAGRGAEQIYRLGGENRRSSFTDLADQMRSGLDENLPRGQNAGFWTGDVAEGVGQFIPMVLTGAGAGSLAARGLTGAAAASARMAGASLAAGAAGLGMEFDDAFGRELDRQAAQGEPPNPDLAFAKALGYGAISSLIEARLGAGRVAQRLGRALTGETAQELVRRGVTPGLVRQVVGSGIHEAGVGAGQEFAQRLAQDLIVEGKPDFRAAGYEGLVGATVQGLTGLPIGAIESSSARREALAQQAVAESRRQQMEQQLRQNQLIDQMAAGREAAMRRSYPAEPDYSAATEELRQWQRAEAEMRRREGLIDFSPFDTAGGMPSEAEPESGVVTEADRAIGQSYDLEAQKRPAQQVGLIDAPPVAVTPPPPQRNLRSRQTFAPQTEEERVAQMTPAQRRAYDMLRRIERERQANAEAIRSDEGQPSQQGGAVETGEGAGGTDVEQAPPGQSESVEQRAAEAPPAVAPVTDLGTTPTRQGTPETAPSTPVSAAGVVAPATSGSEQPRGGESVEGQGQRQGQKVLKSRRFVSIEDEDATAQESDVQDLGSKKSLQKKADEQTLAVASTPIMVGAGGTQRVYVGDQVEFYPEYQIKRRATKSSERLRGVARGRVVGLTPSGGVRVEVMEEQAPSKMRPKYQGKTWVIGAQMLHSTGRKYGTSKSDRPTIEPVKPETLQRLGVTANDQPLTREEVRQFLSLGYDYDDLWSMESAEARGLIVMGKRGPGKRPMMIGRRVIGQPKDLETAKYGWSPRTELRPAALYVIADILGRLRALGLRSKVVSARSTSTPFESYRKALEIERLAEFRRKMQELRGQTKAKKGKAKSVSQARQMDVVETPVTDLSAAIENQDEYNDLTDLAELLGKPDNPEAAAVFARRFWENIGTIAAPIDQQIQLIQRLIEGQPTPIEQQTKELEQLPGGEESARRMRQTFRDASGGTPWIGVTAGLNGRGPAVEIGQDVREVFDRLGVSLTEDPTLDRAAAVTIHDNGQIELRINPNWLGGLDPAAQAAAVQEELIHAAGLRVMAREWEAAGRQGSLSQWVDQQLGLIYQELPQSTQDELRRVRDEGESPAQLGAEAVRRVVQLARTGQLTEDYVGQAKGRLAKLFRQIWDFISRALVGDRLGSRGSQLRLATEAVLDGLAIPISGGDGSGSSTFGATRGLRSRDQLFEMASRGGLEEVPPEMERRVGAASSMFPVEQASQILQRYDELTMPPASRPVELTANQLRRERITASILRPVVDKLRLANTRLDSATLPDDRERENAAYATLDTHAWLRDKRTQLQFLLTKLQAWREANENFPDRSAAAKVEGDLLSNASHRLVSDYKEYLDNVARLADPGSTLAGRARALSNAAARQALAAQGEGHLFSAGHVHNLLRWMASQPAITLGPEETAASVTEKAAELVGHIGADTLGMPQHVVDLLLFGERDPSAAAPGNLLIEPALYHVTNLPDIVGALRVLRQETQQTVDRRQEFQQIINLKPDRAVTPRQFVRQYDQLRDRYAAAYHLARALDKRWAENENKLAGTAEGLAILDELMEDPRYRRSVASAARQVNAYIDPFHFSQNNSGSWEIVDPIENRLVEIRPGLTKAEEEENAAKIDRLLVNIGRLTNGEPMADGRHPDPLKLVSYERAGIQLAAMWSDLRLSPEFNVHNRRIGGIFPRLLKPLVNKKYLAEYLGGRPGRMIGLSVNHLDRLLGRVSNILVDDNHGVAATQLAYRRAMAEHGLDPDRPADIVQYQREVANPLLYSWQHDSQFHYQVGHTLPSGRVVSSTDMAAVKLEHRFKAEIRRESERDATYHNMPSSIAEQIGIERRVDGKVVPGTGSFIHRKSIADGPMTVARRSQIGDRRAFVDAFVAADTAQKLQMLSPSNDPAAFYDVVVGYIFSTHPDFKRNSVYESKLRRLVRDGAEGLVIKDWNDLAEYLDEPVEEVQRKLLPEISEWIGRYSTIEIGNPTVDKREVESVAPKAGRDMSSPLTTIIESLHNDGSFLHPRLMSSAPWTFYNYADVDSASLHSYAANATNIARARVLDALMQAKLGIDAFINRHTSESSPAGLKLTQKESERLRNNGQLRFDLAEAERMSSQLEYLLKDFGTYANRHAEAFDKGVVQFIRMMNSMVAGSYLQSPNSVKNNFVSAAFVNPIISQAMVGNSLGVLAAPFSVAGDIARLAMGRLVKAGRSNPAFARWLNDNRGLVSRGLRLMADEWETTSKVWGDLRRHGINTGLDWANQRRLRSEQTRGTLLNADRWREIPQRGPGAVIPGAGGLEEPNNESSALLKFGRWVFQSWVPAMAMRYLPRSIDQAANTLITMQWMKAIGQLQAKAISLSKQRVERQLGGDVSKLDHTNKALLIKPEELGMTATQLRQLSATLHPVGSLERILFDYYKAYQDAIDNGSDPSSVPLMDDERMHNWMMSLLELGNVVREGNALDFFKAMGTVGNIIGMFWSWPSNFFLQFGKLFERTPLAKGGTPYVAAVMMIMLTAIAAKELPMGLIELLTGKVSGQQRLANVLNDPTAMDTARYAASTFGTMVPFIGNNIDFLVGGSSSRPIFDATSMIPMVGFMTDTFHTAKEMARSGDPRLALDWANRHAPLYAMVANRLPGGAQDLQARNATRAIRAAVPSDMEVRQQMGGGGIGMTKVTPYTSSLRSAEAAAYAGDEAGVRRNIERAKRYQMDRGQTEDDAERSVVSYLRSRMPTSKVFGRAISPGEMSRLRSRMNASQAQAFEPSERAYRTIERVTGSNFSPVRQPRQTKLAGRQLRSLRQPELRLLRRPRATLGRSYAASGTTAL